MGTVRWRAFLEPRRITDKAGAGSLAPIRGFAARAARGSRRQRRGGGLGPGRGRGRGHDTTRGARTPTRSRDVTATRGDVDVNRGRDARNHDDRRTDRTIVRDRSSTALLFLSFSPFSSSRVFISTTEVSANRRAPSCFLAIVSGTDRNGATTGRTDGTDGRTRHSWRETPRRAARGNRTGGTRRNRTDRTRVRIGARAILEAATRPPIIDALMTSGRLGHANRRTPTDVLCLLNHRLICNTDREWN